MLILDVVFYQRYSRWMRQMYLYYPKPIDAERISPPLKEKKKPSPFYYACITLPDHQRLSMMKKERQSLLLWRIFRYTYNVNAIIIFSSPVFRKIELFVSKWHNSLFCNTYIMFSNCYLLSDHTMYIYPGMSKWKIKISLLPNSSCWMFLRAEDLVQQHNFICLREIFTKDHFILHVNFTCTSISRTTIYAEYLTHFTSLEILKK